MYQSGLKLLKAFNLFSGKCLVRSSAPMTTIYKRQLSSSHSKIQALTRTLSFSSYMKFRRDEALRTVVFEVDDASKYSELLSHCLQYGNVNATFLYHGNSGEKLILVEFAVKDSVDELIRSNKSMDADSRQWSRFPVFTEQMRKAAPNRNVSDSVPLNTELGQPPIRRSELYRLLNEEQSIVGQIDTLFRRTSMNDLLIRHRYLALVQIEDSARGMSPNVRTYPFGSSASGFGKSTSDLDMVLVNHDLTVPSMAGVMDHMPGINNLQPLAKASIPIIKYQQGFLNLEVDISFDQLRGVYGTELLYFCCQLEERLRPLIFILRWWADRMGVCKITPGPWIKNYGMNLLTVFYLQQLKILPPINDITNLNRVKAIDSEAVFITDLKTLDFKTTNTDSIAELLVGFFKFYSNFEFNKCAICLDQGITVKKVDLSVVDILDFFGTENTTCNVTPKEFKKLKKAFDDSNAVELEFHRPERSADESWGLVKWFQSCEDRKIRKKTKRETQPRM